MSAVHEGDLSEIVEEDVLGTRLRVFRHAPPTLRATWLASAAHGDAPHLAHDDERTGAGTGAAR